MGPLPKRADLRLERADLRPDRIDLRPDRVDFRPERAGGDSQTNKQNSCKSVRWSVVPVPCLGRS